MTIRCLFCALLIAFLTLPSLAEDMVIDRYRFDNPLGPTKVEKLGLDAYSCQWPADVPYKEAKIELIVVTYEKKAVTKMREVKASPYNAALNNFMGLFGEPESINKTLFFGSTSARKVYTSKVPRPHKSNVFSKTLKDGSFVLVGVRSFASPNPQVGDLTRAIGNTFKVKE